MLAADHPITPTSADPDWLAGAYAAYHDVLVAVAWRVLRDSSVAEDVVQDVFLDLWRSPAAFDPERGSLATYLRLVVRSRALDRWRSRAVANSAVERVKADFSLAEGSAGGADERVIHHETVRAVRAAVDELPPPQREAILLAYGGGLSAREVARLTGAPLGTAKGRMRLGLSAARRRLAAVGMAA